jgi:hypothetical protein
MNPADRHVTGLAAWNEGVGEHVRSRFHLPLLGAKKERLQGPEASEPKGICPGDRKPVRLRIALDPHRSKKPVLPPDRLSMEHALSNYDPAA